MSDNLPRSQIRYRIGLFSAAAPVGALVTYLSVITLASGLDHKVLMWWTGVSLLFSVRSSLPLLPLLFFFFFALQSTY
jgi:hypothetical protein